MNEIGSNFEEVRTSNSISLEEASTDTGIPVEALEQIEAGSIGSFKDIFVLKDYLQTYAKYLGLDPVKVIDDFNEYMFEYTSKIPLDDLAKEIEKKNQEEKLENTREVKIVSPYLSPKEESNNAVKYIIIGVIIVVLAAVLMIWAIQMVQS